MSPNVPFQKFPKADPRPLSSPQAEKVAGILYGAFELLSIEDQQVVLDRMLSTSRVIPATRAGEVLGTVVRFLHKQREWTASQIRRELIEQGISVDQRAVFNAIGYLARKGSIQRLGGGRYVVDGIGVQFPDEVDECGR